MESETWGETPDDEDKAPHGAPFRFWMTQCMAVVMAAFVGTSAARGVERGGLRSQLSPFGMAETTQRIEASAGRRGLQVFALVDRPVRTGARDGEFSQVLVLASREGGTLVTIEHAGAAPQVPMSLILRTRNDGGTEVLIAPEPAANAHGELPPTLRRALADLPDVVADALR